MSIILTEEEEERCLVYQTIYDQFEKASLEFEGRRQSGRTVEDEHMDTRKRARIAQEEEWVDMLLNIEDGEVIDYIIELEDYRLMRCVYGNHLEPKERIIEIPIGSKAYLHYFGLSY